MIPCKSKMLFIALTMIVVMLCMLLRANTNIAHAASATNDNKPSELYDPIVLPINGQELQEGLIHNSHNAVAEYQLLLRAGYQHQEQTAYDTMNQLCKEQPDNSIVLAGYFMSLRMAEGGVNTLLYNGGRQVIPTVISINNDARVRLQKAYRLEPNLWMIYTVDGEDQYFDPIGNRKHGLALLQKAEDLAPQVPYIHWLLGYVYVNPPLSNEKIQLAIQELQEALASGTKISNAAFIMFQIYSSWRPNRAKALQWKHKFLSLVPPNVKMSPFARQELDQYPG
jgi:hypothetical protein